MVTGILVGCISNKWRQVCFVSLGFVVDNQPETMAVQGTKGLEAAIILGQSVGFTSLQTSSKTHPKLKSRGCGMDRGEYPFRTCSYFQERYLETKRNWLQFSCRFMVDMQNCRCVSPIHLQKHSETSAAKDDTLKDVFAPPKFNRHSPWKVTQTH